MEPGKKDHPLLNTKFAEVNARFSPDGRWLVYISNESGNPEVYAISYPDLSRKVQISTSGGYQPRWRKDGREIYFISRDGNLNAVTVQTKADNLAVGTPQPLFQTKIAQIERAGHQYDVTADGQRFLINTRPEAASEALTLYSNWQAEIKR